MTRTYRVTITRKPGLSEPEGATTRKALNDLGFAAVESVSFGRILTIDIDAASDDEARAQLEDMCSKLLANPVMENHTIEGIT
ncbi:MAG: phosphoribosylformylglycinamidine synthase subunit PurS [Acidimicrobiia bacterium]